MKRRRNRPRARSLPLARLARQNRAETVAPAEESRPRVRADCRPGGDNAARPCPWVGCRHHMYLDVDHETGSIKLNFPWLEPWEMVDSCSLDFAERGGLTLEEVGEICNLTRERIRQLEVRGLIKLKMTEGIDELA